MSSDSLASRLQPARPVMFRPGVFVVVFVLGMTSGGCSLAGRTLGTYVDDKVIRSSVKRSVAANHSRSLRSVSVDAYEGTVYLSGEVETPGQKADAEAAAWNVDGVEQVINDLRVRSDVAVNASPRTTEMIPLQERLPGLRRIDPAPPGGPALAYDAAGTLVATVFVRSLRDVGLNGFDEVGPTVQPINHISLYPVAPGAGQPEALVTIVLWHISRAAAAALK